MHQEFEEDEPRLRLEMLRREQERLMFNPYEFSKRGRDGRHPLDFTCQCRNCVRLHTISMQDREFLKTIGVCWNGRKDHSEEPVQS